MRTGRNWLWMVGVVALSVAAACGDDDDGDSGGAGDVENPPPAATVSFEQQIHPVLVAKCAACHGDAWGSADAAASYQAARTEVDTANPAQSDLYERGNGQQGHAKVYSDAEAALVLLWIQQGATGPATTPPPPTAATFTQVHPILVSKCGACHVTGGLAGSVPFAQSDKAAAYGVIGTQSLATPADQTAPLYQAASGQLSGHGAFATVVSDAERQQILSWIQAGAKND